MLSSALVASLRVTAGPRPAGLLVAAAVAAGPPSSSYYHTPFATSGPTFVRTYANGSKPKHKDADHVGSGDLSKSAEVGTDALQEAAAAAARSADSSSSNTQQLRTPAAAGARTAATPTPVSPSPFQPQTQPQNSPVRQGPSAFDVDTSLMAIADQAADGGAGGGGGQGGRTGARARSNAQQSSIEKSRGNMRKVLGLVLLGTSGYLVASLAKDWETVKERERFAENPLSDSPTGRVRLRLAAMWEDFHAPVWEKLLPDVLPFPYSRPYTLVVDLDDLLVHSHWTREHGWRTAKRPGLDYFLAYLGQFYEIVIWTTQPYYVVAPIIEKLDPDRRNVAYTLFRESCRTHNGKVVKDLSALNRDLSKVVVLDVDPDRVSMQSENAVLIKKWNGEARDAELLGMLPFLEAIALYQTPDVRVPIKTYEGLDIPTEYNKRQRDATAAEDARWLAEQEKRSKYNSLTSWFGGLKSSTSSSSSAGATSTTTASGRPKTFYELERDRYQAGYAEDQKYWKENGEAIRKQAKEEQERQIKEMKLSAWGMLTGQGMKRPDAPEGQDKQP